MPGSVTTRRLDDTAVIEVSGELDLLAAPTLAAAVAVARVGHERLVVDLSRVEFIDSTALRELLGQATTSKAAGRAFVLVAPRGPARRIFEVTSTWDKFAWIEGAPDDGDFEPLPRRVARHRAALAIIESIAGDGQLPDVARLISDAVGDGVAINRVSEGTVEPLALVHRERSAEALMQRTLSDPSPIAGSPVFRDVVGNRRPVFLAASEVPPVLASSRPYVQARGLGALACLPLGGPGAVRGLLGCSRDGGRDPYDAEDRVFLTRAAQALSACSTFTAAASG